MTHVPKSTGRLCSRCRERVCDPRQRWCPPCRVESGRANGAKKREPQQPWTNVKLTKARLRELDVLASGPEICYGALLPGLSKLKQTELMVELFDTIRAPGRAYSLEQIGEAIGVTRERVRQIEAEGLKRLRKRIPAERVQALLLLLDEITAAGRRAGKPTAKKGRS